MGLRIKLGLLSTVIAMVAMTGTAGAQTETKTFNGSGLSFQDLGQADPYPRDIQVSGVRGLITDLGLKFDNFSSDRPADVDTLLVGPDGKSLTPISDAGGTTPVGGLDWTFQDGTTPFSMAGPLISGTFQPTDYDPNEPMNAPAPAPPFGTTLSQYKGTNANGTWRLFGFTDFFDGDSDGSLSGWTLTITSKPPTVDVTASKQKLGGKVKVTATSNVDTTFVLSGGVKANSTQLKADTKTVVKAKLNKKTKKRLAAKLADGQKAKLNVTGSATDVTDAVAKDSVKVKFK